MGHAEKVISEVQQLPVYQTEKTDPMENYLHPIDQITKATDMKNAFMHLILDSREYLPRNNSIMKNPGIRERLTGKVQLIENER